MLCLGGENFIAAKEVPVEVATEFQILQNRIIVTVCQPCDLKN